MSTTVRPYDDQLQAAVAAPHRRVLQALGEDPPNSLVVAVAWSSAHLVAVDRVLYPAVLRHLPEHRQAVRATRAVDRRLQQAAFRLDRRVTGDSTLHDVPLATLVLQAREALRGHVYAEAFLIDELTGVLTEREQQVLAQRLAVAMGAAPTRPHPYARHTPLSPLVGWCDALVDRARDAMDNRGDPLGRPPRAVTAPGRWGCYLLGIPHPADPAARPGAAAGSG